jgi:hypothetical protein
MQDKNLFAFTAAPDGRTYPEYISVNLVDNGTRVRISVRSPPQGDKCGSEASIILTLGQYESFRRRLA